MATGLKLLTQVTRRLLRMSDLDNQNNELQSALSSEPKYPTDTFPHKYVHSVFENRQDAERAVQALLDAGFTADDINYMTSHDFIQAAEKGEHENKSLAKSLTHFVSSLDHNVTDTYLNEAHRGNDILSVRITKTDQMAQVRDILAPYHARHIQYIDTWTQADLSNTRHRGDW
jgi:hypothetical protein